MNPRRTANVSAKETRGNQRANTTVTQDGKDLADDAARVFADLDPRNRRRRLLGSGWKARTVDYFD